MALKRMTIERFATQTNCTKQILGIMFILDEKEKIAFKCFTLELPDNGNKQKISNIPAGKYKVVKRNSPKYGDHFHITNVKNRSFVLIHQGNYYTQIEGCVLVGVDMVDVNGDGVLDVTQSVATMKKLNSIMPREFELEIIQ